MNLETIYLARERYKEMIGETPKPQTEFFRPNLKHNLASLFYALAAKLEPQRYQPRRLAK